MENLIVHQYEQYSIVFTPDGWINATKTANYFNKHPSDYLKLDRTLEYIKVVAEERKILSADLLRVIKGGNNRDTQGTFLHPELALDFARWISPKFGRWCDKIISALLRGELTLKQDQDYQEVKQLLQHLDREVQVCNSKSVNQYMYQKGGKDEVRRYNTEQCKAFADGKKPSEIIEEGKQLGLSKRQRSSAKEVLRHIKSEGAAGMSLTDYLVVGDVEENEARETGKLVIPIFEKLRLAEANLKLKISK